MPKSKPDYAASFYSPFPCPPAVSTQEPKQNTDLLLIQFQTGSDFEQIAQAAPDCSLLSIAHLKGEAWHPKRDLGSCCPQELCAWLLPVSGPPKGHRCLWAPAAIPPTRERPSFLPFIKLQPMSSVVAFSILHTKFSIAPDVATAEELFPSHLLWQCVEHIDLTPTHCSLTKDC